MGDRNQPKSCLLWENPLVDINARRYGIRLSSLGWEKNSTQLSNRTGKFQQRFKIKEGKVFKVKKHF